ncbi:vegetative cell wall protein gp1-like [Aquila chrysaetos chrysaetos]|uniref:vegetative cell wall protein gp1-like n=1 Tax=Aquila chrysaetos chrysaetos TaxID=223781 RepID=UPI0011772682|nr:vegetative cell wall protein gp1-like [Aquila chrysaetos chrysaetos]
MGTIEAQDEHMAADGRHPGAAGAAAPTATPPRAAPPTLSTAGIGARGSANGFQRPPSAPLCRRRRSPPRALAAAGAPSAPRRAATPSPARGETARQCRVPTENPLPAHPLRHRPAGRPKQRRPLYLGDAPPRWRQPLLRDERSRRRLRGSLVPPARSAPPGPDRGRASRGPAAPGCPAGRAGARPQGALVARTHPPQRGPEQPPFEGFEPERDPYQPQQAEPGPASYEYQGVRQGSDQPQGLRKSISQPEAPDEDPYQEQDQRGSVGRTHAPGRAPHQSQTPMQHLYHLRGAEQAS